MNGEFQILLLVLLSVAVGAAALIYYLRKRVGSSSAEVARCTRWSESHLGDEAGTTPHASCKEGEQSAVALETDTDDAIVDVRAPRAELRPRADEHTEGVDLIEGHQAGVVIEPTAAAREQRFADGGREPEAQAESETNLPDAAETRKAEAPAVEPDVAVSEAPDTEAGHVRSGTPAPGAEAGVAADEESVKQPEIKGGHAPAGAGDEQVYLRTESTTPPAGNEEAIPSDISTVSGEDNTGTGGLDKDQRDTKPAGQMAEDGLEGREQDNELTPDSASFTQPSQKKQVKRKTPHKYRGLARAAPQPRDVTPQTAPLGGKEPAQRERSLPIEVRLRFDRGGFCSVSLIAKRNSGLPEDLTVVAPGGEVNLRAMQDEWYQDVTPHDLARVLKEGTVWTYDEASAQCTWSLSGRRLYVLADRADISGYVSQPCLDLGRDHVVLCSEPLRGQVEDAIRQTGAQPTTVLDESFGAPSGWVVFRGVVPVAPVAPVGEADLFNALRPLPRIEISLERGIRLGYANWLDGHPPLVRVYGDPEHATEVRIDGQVAACGSDCAYRVLGWDSLGSHTVWCSGRSRSYSIVPFDASWDLWEGYAFSVSPGEMRRLTVCGPIVQAVAIEASSARASTPVSVTNPVLIGPEPGQIAMAMRVSALGGAPCLASPSFHPVWALPRDPLHCDKKTTQIVLLGGKETWESPTSSGLGVNSRRDSDVTQWCRLILDASRKGMATAPETESVRALWLSYKRLARQLWRSRR